MSNIWKRSLSLFLALVMVFGMMPVSAFATETDPGNEGTTTETPAETTTPGAPETSAPAVPETSLPDVPETTVAPADDGEEESVDDGEEEPADEGEEAPEVDEAVAAVQAMIDALPGAEQFDTSLYGSQEAYEAALAELEAKLDAIDAAAEGFTEEQHSKLDDTKFIASWNIINGYWLSMAPMLIEWVEENGTNYVDMLNGAYTKGQLYTVLSTKWCS